MIRVHVLRLYLRMVVWVSDFWCVLCVVSFCVCVCEGGADQSSSIRALRVISVWDGCVSGVGLSLLQI